MSTCEKSQRDNNQWTDAMSLSSKVYLSCVNSHGIWRRIWMFARKLLISVFRDPLCEMRVHGCSLSMPLSHPLPVLLKQFPCYDRLPSRISRYVHNTRGALRCIDVGANIGDTIAALMPNENDRFLAIEPNPKFLKYLRKNWGANPNVTIVAHVCSSLSSAATFSIIEGNGTARITESTGVQVAGCRTLDEIVAEHSDFRQVNVIKIDTDGHDFEVLCGAKSTITESQPIVLFECDLFENKHLVGDVLSTLIFFRSCGYADLLIYDNVGKLIGKFSLADYSVVQQLLFYKLQGGVCYFDMLLLTEKDAKEFYESEIAWFENREPDSAIRTAMRDVFAKRDVE